MLFYLRAEVNRGKRNEQGRLKYKYQQEISDKLDYLVDDLSCFWQMSLKPYLDGAKGYRLERDRITFSLMDSAFRGVVATCVEKLCVFGYSEARPFISKYTWFLKYMFTELKAPDFMVTGYEGMLKSEITRYRNMK